MLQDTGRSVNFVAVFKQRHMITFPNAKVNLGLNIVERRPDGYHNIETVFHPIALCDVLEIVPSPDGATSLHCYGNPVDCPVEKNLVMRACRLMQAQHGVPAIHLHLYKHIPDGAGLGGGSSDATHTLLMLNKMYDLRLDDATLAQMAATIGADCPFFVYNRPMLATGIGDVFTPVTMDLSTMVALVVKPPVLIPTREAYAGVTPAPSTQSLAEAVARRLEQWGGAVKNDFERSIFAQHPQLAAIKQQLIDGGARYAAMSGSGSALFGIFDSDIVADRLRDNFDGCDTFVVPMTANLN